MSENRKQGRPSKAEKLLREAAQKQRQQEVSNKLKAEQEQQNQQPKKQEMKEPENQEPVIQPVVEPANNDAGYDPFASKIIDREYSTNPISQVGTNAPASAAGAIEAEIAEPQYTQPLVNPNETTEGGEGVDAPAERQPVNPALKELSDQEKKRAAKQTAKMFMVSYCNLVPKPFMHFSKFSEAKTTKMAMNGEIDLDMRLQTGENSFTTVREYFDNNNKQVDEIFAVKEETRESIEDALTDVLMEQGAALTPKQRFLFAVSMHVLEMGMNTASLISENKGALETFVKFRSEEKAKEVPTEVHESTNPRRTDDIQTPDVEVLD